MTSPSSASDSTKGANAVSAPRSEFRLGRVLLIVAVLAAIVLGAFYVFAYGDGAKWISGLFTPKLIPVSGVVLQGGEPIPGAIVNTEPVDKNLKGSVGYADAEGKFTLKVDIDGNLVDGAYAGEHKVTVRRMQMTMAVAAAPPMLTAAKYGSFEESPLRITVDAAKPDNQVKLELEGAPIKMEPPPVAAPSSGGAGLVAARLRDTVNQLDKNKDGALSAEEFKTAPEPLQEELKPADKNSDGALDQAELQERLGGGPGGGGPGGGGPGGGAPGCPEIETEESAEPASGAAPEASAVPEAGAEPETGAEAGAEPETGDASP